MPETAIYKNCRALASKDEIGFSEQRLTSAPTSDLIGTENRNHLQLCRSVPSAFDGCHAPGALNFCKRIHRGSN
jgi:hypothetical protein